MNGYSFCKTVRLYLRGNQLSLANVSRFAKAGVHVRRKHKHKPRVNRDDVPFYCSRALVLASSRFTRGLCLCLRRTCKPAFNVFDFCLSENLLYLTDSLNIAYKRDTKQSSTEHQSALAVDGRHQFASSPELFSSTTAESSPWWGVDLGRSALVDHVVLYFPKDPSQARVWKLEVRIGEIPPDDGIVGPLCGPAVVVLNEWKRHVRCSSVRLGRYVTVRRLAAHDKLLLTEVKVLRAGKLRSGNLYDDGIRMECFAVWNYTILLDYHLRISHGYQCSS